jgi:hypothetical protein
MPFIVSAGQFGNFSLKKPSIAPVAWAQRSAYPHQKRHDIAPGSQLLDFGRAFDAAEVGLQPLEAATGHGDGAFQGVDWRLK